MADAAVKFQQTDTPGVRVRKLSESAENTERQFSEIRKELADLRRARSPVVYAEKNGNVHAVGLGSRSGMLWHARDGRVSVEQPLRVGEWVNFGAHSVITGWNPITTENIWYCRLGSLLFVQYHIDGTSNAALASFTLPYDSLAALGVKNVQVMNNGAWDNGSGYAAIVAGANLVTIDRAAFAAWGAANQKQVIGQFWVRLEI